MITLYFACVMAAACAVACAIFTYAAVASRGESETTFWMVCSFLMAVFTLGFIASAINIVHGG